MLCRNCGTELPDGSEFCSACGKKVSTETFSPLPAGSANESGVVTPMPNKHGIATPPKKHLFRNIVLLVIIVVLASKVLKSCGTNNEEKAYLYSQEVVLESIRTPNSAVFPKYQPEFIENPYGDGTEVIVEVDGEIYEIYTVSAYLDADNMLGVQTRGWYSVDIGIPVEGNKDNYFYENLYFYD